MPASAQLVFLTYLSRSGSTYLARRLDAYQDVVVSLEADFPDGLVAPARAARSPATLEALLDDLYRRPKFSAWNVDRSQLRAALSQRGFPVAFKDALRAALRLYFEDAPSARIWVYKQGSYLWHLPALHQRFPEAKVLFVMRDPRAVYNSQRHAQMSQTGQPMASNPVALGRAFSYAAATAERHQAASWFHCLRYEDLLRHPDRTMSRLQAFLGASDMQADQDTYASRIPADQQHLHRRVHSAPDLARIDAWRSELPAAEVAAVQGAAGAALARHDYAPFDPGRLGARGALRCAAFFGLYATTTALPRVVRRLLR